MDCRFCCVRRATNRDLPTVFGPADLCDDCVQRYGRYLRRRGRRSTPESVTGDPNKVARRNSFPPDPMKAKRCSDARSQSITS
jgi:hypothetical protein